MSHDDNDPNNPLNRMMPSTDNPEYHRKKAAYEKKKVDAAVQGALAQHPHLAERMQPHVKGIRQNPPRSAAPMQASIQTNPPQEEYGYEVQDIYNEPIRPPVTPPPTRPEPKPNPINDHPLLQKLRQDFGIESIPTETTKIGNTEFTFRVLDASSIAAALRFSDSMSIVSRENDINMQIAIVSFSVFEIDGTPLWQIFDIKLDENEKVFVEGEYKPVFNPKKPPERVRVSAAAKFMDFLNKESALDLLNSLWEFYLEKVDTKGSLARIVKDSNNGGGSPEDIPLS